MSALANRLATVRGNQSQSTVSMFSVEGATFQEAAIQFVDSSNKATLGSLIGPMVTRINNASDKANEVSLCASEFANAAMRTGWNTSITTSAFYIAIGRIVASSNDRIWAGAK